VQNFKAKAEDIVSRLRPRLRLKVWPWDYFGLGLLLWCVVRNALSLAMMESLKEKLTQDVDSPELRVIILRANGRVFSSGHNLKELVCLI